jgi:hypothetical protein
MASILTGHDANVSELIPAIKRIFFVNKELKLQENFPSRIFHSMITPLLTAISSQAGKERLCPHTHTSNRSRHSSTAQGKLP